MGIDISTHGNRIVLRKSLLINRIKEMVGFENVPVHSKPTPYAIILIKDKDSAERNNSWSCRSLVGILNFWQALKGNK